MTRRSWIADEVSGNRAALTGEHARHLSQVLRAQVGQEFDISSGTEVRRGRILNIQTDRVEFELGDLIETSVTVPITLALSIFKFDRMEWAIEKCTELGVARIVPVVARRTDSHLGGATIKRVERWRRIAKQASEQSRRVSPPDILDPSQFRDLLTMNAEVRIVLSEVEEQVSLKNAVPPNATSLLIAVGPEGGWKEEELVQFSAAGWISASLGDTILRSETASIAAVSIAFSVLDSGHQQ